MESLPESCSHKSSDTEKEKLNMNNVKYLTAIIITLLCLLACLVTLLCRTPERCKHDLAPMEALEMEKDELKHVRQWQEFKRVCYFRMDPDTQMDVKHIDGNLCTHVIFAFCRIDRKGNVVLGAKSDEKYLRQIAKLKSAYPRLKVMVSLYNEDEFQGFVEAAKNVTIRDRLAKSAVHFMETYHLDGLDLDWEFPNFPKIPFSNSKVYEKIGLTAILKSLRLAFDRKYLLTCAVAAQEMVLMASYDMTDIADEVNWLNLMTYDYSLFKFYSPFTGPNAPLYPVVPSFIPIFGSLSIDWTVNKYLSLGVDKEKIVMGIPTYARGYRLLLPSIITSYLTPQPFMLAIEAKGGKVHDYYDYREVCQFMQNNETNRYSFDKRARVPYMLVKERNIWISYEDERSIKEKINYVIQKHLGGYMTWNLNSDNFNQSCQLGDDRKNILHSTMLNHARDLIEYAHQSSSI